MTGLRTLDDARASAGLAICRVLGVRLAAQEPQGRDRRALDVNITSSSSLSARSVRYRCAPN